MTAEADATTYNNFYEFGTDKGIYRAAQRLVTSPWSISIEGMVVKPRKIDLADLLKQMPLEERIYRHRCVEGWAMTVPWTGFPLSALVRLAEPAGSAKFVVFETQADPKTMPGLQASAFDWPYIEGVTMDEAMNDMSFMVTGMYGKTLPKQDGAPIRLALPWKYGFKSAKSIVKITFTDKRPETFWEGLQPAEYGFWANVNQPSLIRVGVKQPSGFWALTSGSQPRSIMAMASLSHSCILGSATRSCSCDGGKSFRGTVGGLPCGGGCGRVANAHRTDTRPSPVDGEQQCAWVV